MDRLSPVAKKLFGVGASAVAGVMYGLNFTPPAYVSQHPDKFPGASSALIDYVLPHFCGVFAATTVYFLIYAGVNRNKPTLFPEIVLPGFASGSVWSIAQVAWFVANARLSFSVAFPLISCGPVRVRMLRLANRFLPPPLPAPSSRSPHAPLSLRRHPTPPHHPPPRPVTPGPGGRAVERVCVWRDPGQAQLHAAGRRVRARRVQRRHHRAEQVTRYRGCSSVCRCACAPRGVWG